MMCNKRKRKPTSKGSTSHACHPPPTSHVCTNFFFFFRHLYFLDLIKNIWFPCSYLLYPLTYITLLLAHSQGPPHRRCLYTASGPYLSSTISGNSGTHCASGRVPSWPPPSPPPHSWTHLGLWEGGGSFSLLVGKGWGVLRRYRTWSPRPDPASKTQTLGPLPQCTVGSNGRTSGHMCM